DMTDCLPFRAGRAGSFSSMSMRVIEMARRIPKCVYLEILQQVDWYITEQPVQDHTALDSPLAVEDAADFCEVRVSKGLLDEHVAVAYVLSRVGEVSLDETLDNVEDNTGSRFGN